MNCLGRFVMSVLRGVDVLCLGLRMLVILLFLVVFVVFGVGG